MLHRDIKTSNILLTAEGVAKIADVGLAKMLVSVDQSSIEHMAGTFAYAAPEVLLGTRTTSTKVRCSFRNVANRTGHWTASDSAYVAPEALLV